MCDYQLVGRAWSKRSLELAMADRDVNNTSFPELEDKYNIPKATLYRHYVKHKLGLPLWTETRGRKPVFNAEETKELTNVIINLAEIGFAPRTKDLAYLVESYVMHNDLDAAKRVFKHKGNVGRPGPEWVNKFIKDNTLSIKDATKLSVARHTATRNPFVIYHFYDLLEKTIKNLKLEKRPDLIWNLDESGMPYDPRNCRVISKRGQKTFQIVPGQSRDNTTILAACSASGKALPPLIVYEGLFVQTTWRPNVDKNYEFYPWQYANKSGWMDSSLFYKWFEIFEERTRTLDKDNNVEPRLVIYDGHLSHVWYGTTELARTNKMTILKLPPHTTELLQPLDVSVFKSLKDKWGQEMFERRTVNLSRLNKREFAERLCSEGVWKMAFSKENRESGFRRTGIYTVDRTKYPKHRFHPTAMKKYDDWVADGKPNLTVSSINNCEMALT